MHKRKVTGILPYGNRLSYKKVIKFQEGGHVAVSKAYDWREDPYELMLLQQKAANDNAKLKYSAKEKAASATKPTKPVKSILGDFAEIKGGLKASRESAQAEVQKLTTAFYDAVKNNDENWLYSNEAAQAFSSIQTKISNLTEEIQNEKEEFDKLRGNISEGSLSAKAISVDGAAFVTAKDGPDLKNPFISMTDYYKSPEKYNIGTISEFIDWKTNKDYSRNIQISSMFLGDNALGDSDLRDMYIKDRGEVQFKIDKGMLIATENTASADAGNEIGSVDQVLRSVKGVLSRTAVTDEKMGTEDLANLNKVIREVSDSVYASELHSNSRLRSSMLSQAVQDPRVMNQLAKLPQDQRSKYMDDAIGALWIEKIISKNYPGKIDSSSGGTAPKLTSQADQLGEAQYAMFDSPFKEQYIQGSLVSIGADGDTSAVYDYDASARDNAMRMMSIGFPAKRNVLSPNVYTNTDAKGEEKKLNFANQNPIIQNNFDTTLTATVDGTPLQEMLPEGMTLNTFLGSYATIEPGSKVDIVAYPRAADGRAIPAATSFIADMKLQARAAYIKAVSTGGKQFKYKPEDIVAGSKNKEIQTIYNQFTAWVDSGTKLEKFEAAYKNAKAKNPNGASVEKRAYDMAKLAETSVLNSLAAVKGNSAIFGGVQMQVYGIYTVNYDDSYSLDGIASNIKDKAKANKFGHGGVKETSDPTVKLIIEEINNTDQAYRFEDIQSLKLIAPIRTMANRAAIAGATWNDVDELGTIEGTLTKGLNRLSTLSNPTKTGTAQLLY